MKTYKKGLIILSAIFILPTFAMAAEEPVDMDSLDVTMTVIESPQDTAKEITNRIEIPGKEYMQARENNRQHSELRRMDGDRNHESMEGSKEMMQSQMQERQQEMMQDKQQDMLMDQQHDMVQDQQHDMVQDQMNTNQTGGHIGSGAGSMGM